VKKKKIPLVILKAIEPVIQKNLDAIKFVDETDTVYSFYDLDRSSEMYFKILSTSTEKGKIYAIIKRQPRHSSDLSVYQVNVEPDKLIAHFNDWIKIIREYNSVQSVLDDPIIKAYEEEFYQEYKIMEEDADRVPFNLNQQLLLDKYLDTVVKKIEKFKGTEKETEALNISKEATSLKMELTSLSKNQTMKRLSKIWAKLRKFGIDTFKTLWKEALKQLAIEIIKGHLK
jgi:hypothetical protein